MSSVVFEGDICKLPEQTDFELIQAGMSFKRESADNPKALRFQICRQPRFHLKEGGKEMTSQFSAGGLTSTAAG